VGADKRAMQGVGRLLVARVALSIAVFALALTLPLDARGLSPAREEGLYATLAFALLATAAFGLPLWRVRNRDHFGAVQIAIDLTIITSLVHFTGGRDSLFTFLYVLVIAYAAILFDRRLALGAAGMGAAAYGSLLVAVQRGRLTDYGSTAGEPLAALVVQAGVHAVALALVALLASALSRELQSAGRALHERTRDLGRLRRLHERIVESLLSGLLTTDPQGRITSFNREAEQITGAPLAEVLGAAVETVIPGVERLLRHAASELFRIERTRERLPYRNRRGDALHLGVAASILRDEEGHPSGHVLIFQDVTRVVEMEHSLRRSERLAGVGELSAALAHELRNPLASMSGAIQMLQGSGDAGTCEPERGRLMGIVLRETERLDRLIADFLQYARPEPRTRESVRVAELVAEVLDVLEGSKPATVRVSTDLPGELRLWADPAQVRQLLWNLLLNAVQAMPDGGTLHVAAARCEGPAPQAAPRGDREVGAGRGEGAVWTEIEVADSGSGIAPEILDRIFDPFFTTKETGTGLGLATVHRLVEANGGHLRVESAPGAGTRFRIRLPAGKGAA
jgi:two-component system sensor histidine kinase PilS (NtrC family)